MNKICLFITGFVIIALSLLGCSKKYSLKRTEINKSAEWSFYRGGLNAKGAVPESDFSGKLDIVWEFSSNDKPVGPLTIYNDYLIYPGARNKIKFIQSETGKYNGYIKSKGTAQTGLIISDSLGYFAVAAKKSKLKCINLLNRKTVWQKRVKDAAYGSIIIEEKLIVGSSEGRLLALDKSTGEILWVYNCESRLTLPPTFGNNRIWQPGDNGMLFQIDPEDGQEILSVSLSHPIVTTVAFDQFVYVADLGGILYKIDSNDGSVIWQKEIGGSVYGSVSVANDRIYIGHSGGEVLSISTNDGSVLWRYNIIDVITAPLLLVGKYIVFGSKTGEFFSLSAADGSLVEKRKLNGAVSFAPVTDGDNIFVATDKGMITCFGERDDTQGQKQ